MHRSTEKEWKKVSTQPLYLLYRSATDANRFQVRLRASGNYLRRTFSAPDLASALDEAPCVAGLVSDRQAHLISLSEAFQVTLKSANRRELSRKDWLNAAEKFLLWLQKRHPLCTHWGLMSRSILREYLSEYDGKSANYRRLRMQPILQTAGFMYREHGFPNIGERLGIGGKLKKTPPVVYLEDVLSFCDWLREHRPHLEVGACLQGLAGLQLLEALRLTWDKVDMDQGLVEISGEVKNEYRNRVIPVCRRVLEAFRRANEQRLCRSAKDLPVSDHVLVGAMGEAYVEYQSYSRQVRKALKEWNPSLDWAAKDLRNCLPTFSKMEGVHGTIWEQYIGHAPSSVTDRHYVPRLAVRSGGEATALNRQMDLFRKHVTGLVEQKTL